nr:ceramide synthase 1 isoform X3 [Parasteatoda tepidariorum]
MAATSSDWENFPSYFELIKGIREFIYNTYRETFIDQREPQPIELTWRYYNFTTCDILFVLFLAVVWTVLRHIATKNVFKPLAQHYGLTPTNQGKMPESAWKFFYYLSAWCYTSYVVILSGDYKFFQKPSTVWDGWNLDDSPPFNIYFIYMAQCGFYLHSLYATVFLDTWRKDSLVMMIHHVLTLALISFSYSLRYVARLYWYPLRVLYTATSDVQRLQLLLPCALLMNSLLWILQLLNIYWFFFIVQFLFRVATGQVKEVDDTREYDVEEKLLGRKIYSSETIICQNGSANSNGSCDDTRLLNGDVTGTVKKMHLS